MKQGIIFFIIWLLIMVIWGASKNIKPDTREFRDSDSTKSFGHPIWNE